MTYDNPTNPFKPEIFNKSQIRSINELLGNFFFLFSVLFALVVDFLKSSAKDEKRKKNKISKLAFVLS